MIYYCGLNYPAVYTVVEIRSTFSSCHISGANILMHQSRYLSLFIYCLFNQMFMLNLSNILKNDLFCQLIIFV